MSSLLIDTSNSVLFAVDKVTFAAGSTSSAVASVPSSTDFLATGPLLLVDIGSMRDNLANDFVTGAHGIRCGHHSRDGKVVTST